MTWHNIHIFKWVKYVFLFSEIPKEQTYKSMHSQSALGKLKRKSERKREKGQEKEREWEKRDRVSERELNIISLSGSPWTRFSLLINNFLNSLLTVWPSFTLGSKSALC